MSIEDIRGKKALVVGDLIIDYYRILREKRLSPECPVIVFEPIESDVRGGGALNVANNLKSLNMQVQFFSVGGNDIDDFSDFLKSMSFKSDVMKSELRKTTVKERLVTKRQAIARIDHQKIAPIEKHEADHLFFNIQKALKDHDVLVFSDYEHGVLTKELVTNLIDMAKNLGKKVIVNTKSKDYLKYKNCDVIILNHNEAKGIVHLPSASNEEIAEFILDTLNCTAVVLTLGCEGILLREKGSDSYVHFPVVGPREEEVIDVTGAGDTVTATIAACVSAGMNLSKSIEIANIAADIVIKKRGTSTVSLDELIENLDV